MKLQAVKVNYNYHPEDNLDTKQQSIVSRAANILRPADRFSFTKLVVDVARGKPQLSNTDLRHICAASLLKFKNRRYR